MEGLLPFVRRKAVDVEEFNFYITLNKEIRRLNPEIIVAQLILQELRLASASWAFLQLGIVGVTSVSNFEKGLEAASLDRRYRDDSNLVDFDDLGCHVAASLQVLIVVVDVSDLAGDGHTLPIGGADLAIED